MSDIDQFQSLIIQLEQGTAGQRYETVLKLKYLVTTSPHLLEDMLISDSSAVCETAAWLISQIENPPLVCVPKLIALLRVDSRSLQEKVVLALSRFETTEASQAISKLKQEDLFIP